MELKVIAKQLGYLEINYEDLKNEIINELGKYQGLVVTFNDLPKAKQTRAMLNKVLKAIRNRRNELKNEFLKPYEVIENQIQELTDMIEEVVTSIDNQIKSFELKVREEKLKEIEKIWIDMNYQKVPFEKVLRPEYLNKTFTIDRIISEFKDFINKTEQDLKAIDNLIDDIEKAMALKKKYLSTLDFSESLESYYEEKQAEKVLKEEEQSKNDSTVLRIEVIGTKKQLKLLMDFLEKHQYLYKRI